MGEGDPLFRTVHLELDHWNNIPDGYRIHSSSSRDSFLKKQELSCSRVVSFLFKFMAEYLTSRQFEVMRLAFRTYDHAVLALRGIRRGKLKSPNIASTNCRGIVGKLILDIQG